MNTYYIDSEAYKSTESYKNFIASNPSEGSLKIRAYAASEAIPMSGLNIVIEKEIDGDNVIFFEGKTDSSGTIEKIKLPAPKLDLDNLNAPAYTTYQVLAFYKEDNMRVYYVNMYEDVCVVQTINIVPDMSMRVGGFKWL